MLGSNLGPLQLVHWQSDALTTRLDLIRRSSLISILVFLCSHTWPAFRTMFRITSSFWINFQSHLRLPESYNKLPEEGYWKDFHKLVSDFKEASRNFILECSSQKDSQNCEGHQHSYKKILFRFLGPLNKNIILVTLSH